MELWRIITISEIVMEWISLCGSSVGVAVVTRDGIEGKEMIVRKSDKYVSAPGEKSAAARAVQSVKELKSKRKKTG